MEKTDGPGTSENEAVQIERKLKELVQEIADPHISDTIKQILDAFQNRTTALKELVFKDENTGLYNKHYFTAKLRDEVARALRYNRELSMLIIDLGEGFTGKFPEAADTIADTMRRSDTCAYVEKQLLSVLLPETKSGQAERVSEKILNNLQPICQKSRMDAWIGIAELDSSLNDPIKLESAAYRACESAKELQIPVHRAQT